MDNSTQPIGVIALGGDIPQAVLLELSKNKTPLYVVGIKGVTKIEPLKNYNHHMIKPLQMCSLFQYFRRHNCSDLILTGQFFRPRLRDLSFDLGTIKHLPIFLKLQKKGDDTLLKKIRTAFAAEGFKVLSVSEVLPSLAAP